ncbi:hypothetical protein [Xanthomonas sp. 3058]|uniref:hypothetical protein n=1 Tax=Xanthomonas sp. 3058 TaxID=3035314 RepID=UPI001607A2D8|nr:hypothetical protein [Xanthomonas sp. 3058]MBB5866084.1 hypothetical protein [Xanthomonas sp. 3058]
MSGNDHAAAAMQMLLPLHAALPPAAVATATAERVAGRVVMLRRYPSDPQRSAAGRPMPDTST